MGFKARAIKGELRVIVADFGHFEEDLVLFGGPYSNLQAFEAFETAVEARPAICTGDVVAYCGQPAETINALQNTGWPVIAGNCERQLGEKADGCGCGFEDGTTCDLLSQGWYAFASRAVDGTMRSWMRDLPDFGVFVHCGKRYAVVHGGATAINRFLWPNTDFADFQQELEVLRKHVGQIDGVIAGHCGIAFQRQIEDVLWINAGAIGLPPNDGHCETRYGVLTSDGVSFHRLTYNHDAAKNAMQAVGLTQGYDQTLSSGIWPSEDVLPEGLRR